MSGEIGIDSKNQLIRVEFGSESTVGDWKKALEQVQAQADKTGICRILVDVRKQTNLADSGQLFDFAANLPRSLAFAVVCEINLEDHRFIETVATNRSILVKDFKAEPDAIEWLKEWPNKIVNVKDQPPSGCMTVG